MPFDPDVLVKSLSSIASLLSITSSVKRLQADRKINANEAVDLFRQNAKLEQQQFIDDPAMRDSIVAMANVISDQLLDQLTLEAQQCENRHLLDRNRAAGDRDELEEAEEKAAQCMCSVLGSIKRHNKGVLPAKQLQDWWDSYRCS